MESISIESLYIVLLQSSAEGKRHARQTPQHSRPEYRVPWTAVPANLRLRSQQQHRYTQTIDT